MTDLKSILILIYFIATILFESCHTDVCIEKNSCLCWITSNTKIDISNLLDGVNAGYLEDSVDRNGKTSTYSFSGCQNYKYTFNYTNESNKTYSVNVTAALLQKNATNHTVMGLAENIKFNFDIEDGYQILYRKGSDIIATVNLVCDQFKQPFFKVINEKSKEFVVSSPKVCIIKEHEGLSGGSVFLIILIVVTTVYLVVGGLILYFIRGARGMEIIPNVDFWRNLPGLVKDGAIFLLSGCKPTFVTSAETYDRI